MIQIGSRIFFDQDGEIISMHGEMQGDVLPRKEITKVDFIDLPYGEIDYTKYKLVKINAESKEPVLEELPHIETEAERLLRENEELENQLLLMADTEVGGIL